MFAKFCPVDDLYGNFLLGDTVNSKFYQPCRNETKHSNALENKITCKSQSPFLARKSLIPYRFALFPKFLRECRVPQTVFRNPPWQIKVLNSFATEWVWKKSNTPQIFRISASFLRLHEVQKKSQTSPFKGFSFEPHYPGTVNQNLLFLYWRWLVSAISRNKQHSTIFRGK